MTVPKALAGQADGLTGFDFKIDATFDDWNQDVNVTAPSSLEAARPVRLEQHVLKRHVATGSGRTHRLGVVRTALQRRCR